MFCATFNDLPDNSYLGNVVVSTGVGSERLVSKIFRDKNKLLRWQQAELGKQMLDVLRRYVNQRERALLATEMDGFQEEAIFQLRLAMEGLREVTMMTVARKVVFNEKLIWAIAPGKASIQRNWIGAMQELIGFSNQILNRGK